MTTSLLRILGFVLASVVTLSLPLLPQTEILNLKLLDWQFNQQRSHFPDPDPGQVVLIGIDEGSYSRLPEPFALWHAHLGNVFSALALGKARVVGLDIALPERSFNSVMPGNDQKLLQGILDLRKLAPLVLGITIGQDGQARKIHAPFLSLAGKTGQGFVLWRMDPDRVVRRFEPWLDGDKKTMPSLVARMAEHLDKPAKSGFIDYGRNASLNYIPLQQVLDWYQNRDEAALRQAFDGKAVFLGTVLPFEDRHYQPVNLAAWEPDNKNFVPGVLLHVQAMRNILGKGLIEPVSRAWITILLLLLLPLWWLVQNEVWALGLAVAGSLSLLLAQGFLLMQGSYLPAATLMLGLWLLLGGRQLLELVLRFQEKRRLQAVFKGYVSPQVLEEILGGALAPGVFGEKRRLCIMFSDIRGFTSLGEKLPPEQLVLLLNRYFEAMTQAIQSHGGTVDKYIGDGIMAFFGAPKPGTNLAMQGFLAAKAKLEQLAELNKNLTAEGLPELRIGIGLHLGDAVVGNIGSSERNNYTAIGDAVNSASRLESLTKELGYPLLVSTEVAQALAGHVDFDDLGEKPIKGRSAMHLYGWRPPQSNVKQNHGKPQEKD